MIGYLLARSNQETFEFNKTQMTGQELINKIRRDLPNDKSYSLYTFIMTANDLTNVIAFINSQTKEGINGHYSIHHYQNVFNHLVNNGASPLYRPACEQAMEWAPISIQNCEYTIPRQSMEWIPVPVS